MLEFVIIVLVVVVGGGVLGGVMRSRDTKELEEGRR